MAFVESWVETDPDGSVITGSLLDDYQRQSKRAMRERLEGDPANPNSGIFESASFSATAIVRAGTARAYAVTAAGVAALTLQDGRIAITTDTQRLFHLKGTGAIELGYIPTAGVGTAVTFGIVSAPGFLLNAVGTYAAGKMYKDATNGLILSGVAGSSFDAVITNGTGVTVFGITTGTVNVQLAGTVTATSSVIAPNFDVSPVGAAFAAGRIYRDATNGLILGGLNGATNLMTFADNAGTAVLRLVNDGAKTVVTEGQHKAASFLITASAGGFTAGKLYVDPTHGLVLAGAVGGTNDAIIANSAGSVALRVPTTTVNIVAGGSITATTTISGTTLTASTAFIGPGTVSATGTIRLATAATINFRNAGNTADVTVITSAAGVVTVDAETSITLNKITTVNGNVLSTGVFRAGATAVAVSAGQLAMGSNSSTTASTGSGGAVALPANPHGYLTWFLGTLNIKIPYYNA